jgi:hypothetical protein
VTKQCEEVESLEKKTVHVSTKCDLCGVEVENGPGELASNTWPAPKYCDQSSEAEINISYARRTLPQWVMVGGTVWRIEVDMCYDCFVGRFLPWVKEQNPQFDGEMELTEWW